MDLAPGAPVDAGPRSSGGLGRQLAFAALGAAVGAVLWWVLAVPQHLVNVIFSTLVGAGAGIAAGRLSGAPRSVAGSLLTLLITAVVILLAQAVITRAYLDWATLNLRGAPSSPDWDGPLGNLRLALDRAGARKGWTRNGSYGWWTISLILALALSWFTARPADREPTS